MGFCAFLGSGVSSLTFVGSTTSTGSTIDPHGDTVIGDLAVLVDQKFVLNGGAPAAVVPTGFAQISSLGLTFAAGFFDDEGNRVVISCRKLASTGTITGMSGGDRINKALLIFRPNAEIDAISFSTPNEQATTGNPSPQSVLAVGQSPPILVIGSAANSGATGAPSLSLSPAVDGTINSVSGPTYLSVPYKIYNSSPADHSIDANDSGDSNLLQSFYIQVS